MSQVETHRPDELAASDRDRWIGLLQAQEHPSPLTHPDFARCVALHRPDARILSARDTAGRHAYLAFHRSVFGTGRPIGAALSDYHGWLSEPGFDLDPKTMLKAAGISAYRYFSALKPGLSAPGDGQGLVADSAAGDTADLVRSHKPARAKQYRRLLRKLAREAGPVTLIADDHDPGTFQSLLAWKSAHFERTARHNILSTAWVRGVIDNVWETRGGDWGGRMVTLYAGDRAVAAEFGPFWNGVFHPWIAAYDWAYAPYSPGHLLVFNLLDSMPDNGISRYDLGADDAAYKSEFANATVPTYRGVITARNGFKPVANIEGQSLIHKAARRWEQIVLAEPTFTGRLTGLAGATRALMPGL